MRLCEVLLMVSVTLVALGGLSDMTGYRFFGISRDHYWNDGMYLAVLAIAVHVLYRK
jgi:hypothetical protein